jgi:hypothetical protein
MDILSTIAGLGSSLAREQAAANPTALAAANGTAGTGDQT